MKSHFYWVIATFTNSQTMEGDDASPYEFSDVIEVIQKQDLADDAYFDSLKANLLSAIASVAVNQQLVSKAEDARIEISNVSKLN